MASERFGRRTVEISNPDKVLFPKDGVTKRDLIEYYQSVAGIMLPHMKNRPLTLRRFPDGIGKKGFYQQNRSDFFPDWIKSQKARRSGSKGGSVDHVLCNDRASLAYLANLAVVSFHGWPSRAPKLTRPDRLIFDLDPPGNDFAPVRRGARLLVDLLDEIGLTPHLMTTGSRGLHVVAPIRTDTDFDEARALAREIARTLAREHPKELTVEQRKQKRRGRLYLDVMRNAYGQTGVMPYSVRARPGAPVATPIEIGELGRSGLGPRTYHLKNLPRRLGQREDPWAEIARRAASVARAREQLRRRLGA